VRLEFPFGTTTLSSLVSRRRCLWQSRRCRLESPLIEAVSSSLAGTLAWSTPTSQVIGRALRSDDAVTIAHWWLLSCRHGACSGDLLDHFEVHVGTTACVSIVWLRATELSCLLTGGYTVGEHVVTVGIRGSVRVPGGAAASPTPAPVHVTALCPPGM
jgi:hypothetical protein